MGSLYLAKFILVYNCVMFFIFNFSVIGNLGHSTPLFIVLHSMTVVCARAHACVYVARSGLYFRFV